MSRATAIAIGHNMSAKDHKITQTVTKERPRLLNFIKRSIPDQDEAEDLFQDVMYQFVAGFEQIQSIEKVTSWLYGVTRRKIVDRFRKKKPETFTQQESRLNQHTEENEPISLADILPDLSDLPDQAYWRQVIWDTVKASLEELPKEQRYVFEQHELHHKTFKEMSEETGVTINTLLSRKRYAVRYLRSKLQDLYADL